MRYKGLLGVKYYPSENKAYGYLGHLKIHSIVQSTISIHSMLMLGGRGACPIRNILKNRCSEIKSEVILESKYTHVI